jgi:RsiW-degrading membrane proteinase PrsW (M82 family)
MRHADPTGTTDGSGDKPDLPSQQTPANPPQRAQITFKAGPTWISSVSKRCLLAIALSVTLRSIIDHRIIPMLPILFLPTILGYFYWKYNTHLSPLEFLVRLFWRGYFSSALAFLIEYILLVALQTMFLPDSLDLNSISSFNLWMRIIFYILCKVFFITGFFQSLVFYYLLREARRVFTSNQPMISPRTSSPNGIQVVVFGIVIALGFATLENIIYAMFYQVEDGYLDLLLLVLTRTTITLPAQLISGALLGIRMVLLNPISPSSSTSSAPRNVYGVPIPPMIPHTNLASIIAVPAIFLGTFDFISSFFIIAEAEECSSSDKDRLTCFNSLHLLMLFILAIYIFFGFVYANSKCKALRVRFEEPKDEAPGERQEQNEPAEEDKDLPVPV